MPSKTVPLYEANIREGVARASRDGAVDFRTLFDVVIKVFQDGKVTQADTPHVVRLVEELFDDYVVPWDIPGIPDLYEAFFEAALRKQIAPAIEAVAASILPA